MNTIYGGTPAKSEQETRSAGDCADACKADPACEHWTWSLQSGGCKLLQDITAPPAEKINHISGSKVCEG